MFGGSIRKLGAKLADAMRLKAASFHERAAHNRTSQPPNHGMALSDYTVAITFEHMADVIETATSKESDE